MELIKKSDAIRAVLHNDGQSAVAAVQAIKPINPHGELREMLIDELIDEMIAERKEIKDNLIRRICSHCDSVLVGCEGCPVIGEVKAVFDEQQS